MNRLLLPLCYGGTKSAEFKQLRSLAEEIHLVRNDVVHRGSFSSKEKAGRTIKQAKEFVKTLVGHYEQGFKLSE